MVSPTSRMRPPELVLHRRRPRQPSSASFTRGAETNSLFGLNPGYTKYLIDGRPMANYPALYNGTDVFNNISGIPIDLVERIEILPGGQSSPVRFRRLAGVVNIILKKSMDGSVISARIGGCDEGGGEPAHQRRHRLRQRRRSLPHAARRPVRAPTRSGATSATRPNSSMHGRTPAARRTPAATWGIFGALYGTGRQLLFLRIRTTAPTSPAASAAPGSCRIVRAVTNPTAARSTARLPHAAERRRKRAGLYPRHLRRERQPAALRRPAVQLESTRYHVGSNFTTRWAAAANSPAPQFDLRPEPVRPHPDPARLRARGIRGRRQERRAP